MFKVLIVDDELGIRTLPSEILEDEGYQVYVAEDAFHAKKKVQELDFDLILLDIWMPDMDGISLLKEWNSLRVVNCPVVMMSGHATIETAMEATNSYGAIDFLEKPITMQRLLETCRNSISQWEQRTKQHTIERQTHVGGLVERGWRPNSKPIIIHASLISEDSLYCDHFILRDIPFRPGPDARLPIVEVPDLSFTLNFNCSLRELRDSLERAYFKQVLQFYGGSVTQLAKHAALERTHLYRKLHALGLDLSKAKAKATEMKPLSNGRAIRRNFLK